MLTVWLVAGALAGVGVLTLVDRGATRIYAFPWSGLLWLIQAALLASLVLRTSCPTRFPFQLPPTRWYFFLLAYAAAFGLSAVFSPYRGVSVLATAQPLAGIAAFFLAYSWLALDRTRNADTLSKAFGWFSCLVVVSSLGLWLREDLWTRSDSATSFLQSLRIQNAHPLGHTSYTAGLALLMLPWPALLARRSSGRTRVFWSIVSLLAVAMLFSSGSRGGLIGLGASLFAALGLARWRAQRKLLTAVGIVLVVAAGAFAHPRTRSLWFDHAPDDVAPNLSNVQRSAMAKAGWLMGRERPLFGWGTGATSRAYPKFRSQLDGGVEDALQLHSTPIQLWADLGLVGVVCVGAVVVLVAAAATRGQRQLSDEPSRGTFGAAVLSLAGYGAFSFTDYQLDVPVYTLGLSICIACVAALYAQYSQRPGDELPHRARYLIAGFALSSLVLVAKLGKTDPAPELNVHALQLANDSAQTDRAIALLHESLRLNPDQEIAHFNLGWLLVVREPDAAAQHFLAVAKLVPDKGGVYFGLALSRINRGAAGDAKSATQALALECLNDPIFLVSPWWNNPALQSLRAGTTSSLQTMARSLAATARSRHNRYVEREAEYVPALTDWLEGKRTAVEMVDVANTPERKAFFQRGDPRPDFAKAKVRKYHRERTGYPVLMRDLDLPTPVDVFDVQENDLAAGEYRFLFPVKGWVPSTELLKFLKAE